MAAAGAAAEAGTGAMRAAAEEQWRVSRRDPRLERLALSLREAAVRDSRVDAILERLRQCRAKLRRLDAELLRSVVDDRLALLFGGRQPAGRERAAGADEEEAGRDADHELACRIHVHARSESNSPKSGIRGC